LNKFLHNRNFVENHNQRFKKGIETYEVELNQFADFDNEEFAKMYTS
jgi:hypothetical protein